MICVIAASHQEAEVWARGQLLARAEWFYPESEDDLRRRSNFHVIVVDKTWYNMPLGYFEKIYSLAQQRGSIGRDYK